MSAVLPSAMSAPSRFIGLLLLQFLADLALKIYYVPLKILILSIEGFYVPGADFSVSTTSVC
jgi:hypothetical protein